MGISKLLSMSLIYFFHNRSFKIVAFQSKMIIPQLYKFVK